MRYGDWTFYEGKGCIDCNGTGYRGRMAIFEIMIVSDAIRTLIMDRASSAEVRTRSRQDGMRTLRESGLLAIFDGQTTVEEVLRETMTSL